MLATLHSPKPQQSIDASRSSKETARHWANADRLAAVSEITPQIRDTLRRRSRYECRNNCYAKGLVTTLAGDIVGTGPRLQLLTADPDLNTFVESEWRQWSDVVGLPDKLRILEETRRRDGECFALFRRNSTAEQMGFPSLDLRLLEADQIAHPWGRYSFMQNPQGDDGVVCDPQSGDVTGYKVLRVHPGDQRPLKDRWVADDVAASEVIHWYRADRPGQLRGIPEFSPALTLFAYLRRLNLASVAAAEIAASLTGVLKTDLPPGQEPEEYEPFETIPIDRGMMTSLPYGWSLEQFQTRQQPNTPEMLAAILREIGRSIDVPFGIVAGDCSMYNYSSARLEFLSYDYRQNNDRQRFRACVLDRVFARWLEEARFVYPIVAVLLGGPRLPSRSWHFDGRPSIDPVKDATADEMNLGNSTDTLTAITARAGRDIEDLIREQKREIELYSKYGVPLPVHLRDGDPAQRRPIGVNAA